MVKPEIQAAGQILIQTRAVGICGSEVHAFEGINTHVLPIEEAQQGMELAHTKYDGAIKVVLSFDRSTHR